MRKLLLLLALVALALPCEAARITVSLTSPAYNNAQLDCSLTPSLVPATDPVWCFISIPTLAVLDSCFVFRNTAVTRSYLGADSTRAYKVIAWAARALGNRKLAGCRDSTVKLPTATAAELPPAAPTIRP
jgi:hypothetical protein